MLLQNQCTTDQEVLGSTPSRRAKIVFMIKLITHMSLQKAVIFFLILIVIFILVLTFIF